MTATTPQTFRTFATADQARTFRHEHGTGGWIFDGTDADAGLVILFPPDMPPARIFRHPFTAGRSGRLIGSQ